MSKAREILMALGAAAIVVALVAALRPAAAADYPTRPIRLLVPYAAGGGNDVMARIAADKMSRTLGQQIVVENRGGAGGSIATRDAARSAPDGYTLVIGGTGTLAVDPTLYKDPGYDPRKDFTPIGLIAKSALVILVNPALPVYSVADLIALAKKEPGRLNYASAGVGSGMHLGTVYFASEAGIDMTHIPYKGTGPALTDLAGGHVSVYFSSMPSAIGLVKDGTVRALAVTDSKRSPLFPDLPTVAEAGVPGYEAVLHYGITALWRRPARRARSWNGLTRRCVRPSTRPNSRRKSQPTAPSRSPARRKNTRLISTARKSSGRRL